MTTLPMRPMYLIDGWPDGIIEERAWVEIHEQTPSAASAIEYLEKWMPIADVFIDDDDREHRYVVTGKSWHRPEGYPVPDIPDLRVQHPLKDYGPCAYCDATGKVQVIDKIERRNQTGGSQEDAEARFLGLVANNWNLERLFGRGFVVTRRKDDVCPNCHGSKHEADFIHILDDESIGWEECSPDHPEAMHFWNVEVMEVPEDESPAVEVSDEQTTLPGT